MNGQSDAGAPPGTTPTVAVYGCGDMAREYLLALGALGVPGTRTALVCRNELAAAALRARFGVGGARPGDMLPPAATHAIVCVTQDALPAVARMAAAAGARELLIEKPGALSSSELRALDRDLKAAGVGASVAFNRRFYPATAYCRSAAAADGGIVACYFEATEVERLVLAEREKKRLPRAVLERWGLANATHVVDLALHLAGPCADLECRRSGAVEWHPAGSIFAGSGQTDGGALLAYLASWGTAGRWRVEVTTPRRRLVMCPLETAQEQWAGEFKVSPVDLPAEPAGVKPGLTGMLNEFLGLERAATPRLPTLAETTRTLEIAERIFGYDALD